MAQFFHWEADKLHEFFQRGFMFNFWLHLKKNCLLCFVELFWIFFYSSPLRDFSLMLQLSQIDVTD